MINYAAVTPEQCPFVVIESPHKLLVAEWSPILNHPRLVLLTWRYERWWRVHSYEVSGTFAYEALWGLLDDLATGQAVLYTAPTRRLAVMPGDDRASIKEVA